MSFFTRNIFLFVVFLTGGAVLIIEVAAVRILAPWYGNTIFTFSSVISVILAALSIGYYLGGKMADRHPSAQYFFAIIAAAGLTVFLSQLLAVTVLPKIGYDLSIMTGPLFFSMLMFFLPAVLLGMLSPWAIKLQSLRNPDQGIGATSGKVFFWGTVGSILGSLLAGFVLIPRFGLDAIMLGTGVLLAIMGAAGFAAHGGRRGPAAAFIVVAGAMGIGASLAATAPPPGTVYDRNGVYERITVRDLLMEGRPARVLQQDRAASGLIYLDNRETLDYVKYPTLALLVKPKIGRALAIGGGTYVLPRVLVDSFRDATVDVAEIEPSLYKIGQKYFGVAPDARLRNHITDGRRFLHDASEPFDLIFTDVYYAMTIPSHFATREYHELVRDRLTSGGVYMANLVGDFSPRAPNILFSQMRLIREVFPNSYFFATISPEETGTQSIVAFAINGDTELDLTVPRITNNPNPLLRNLPNKLVDESRIDWKRYALMTDNYAPAEYFALSTLRRELADE